MEIFDIIKSVIFGIVEGITEWLPISSTGHMILLNEILPLRIGKNPDDFYSMFEVVIQLGAILAVVVLFGARSGHSAGRITKLLLQRPASVHGSRLISSCCGFIFLFQLFRQLLSECFLMMYSRDCFTISRQ